jgi:phenylalanyl-tRNA synthetase alpha subunit
MEQLLHQIEQYKNEIESIMPNGADALEAYRIRFLGTKGIVKALFTEMKNVPAERKKEFGLVLNEFKQLAESKYESWKSQTDPSEPSDSSKPDLTLPADTAPLGSRHPISLMILLPYSSALALQWLKGQRSKMTGIISPHSTSLNTILQETCRIHFIYTRIPTGY